LKVRSRMAEPTTWQEIVASSLDWEQAHANLDTALKDLAPEDRGRLADGHPHSVWMLVEHIRITQHDLLEFCVNPKYKEPKWPDDYWPDPNTPPTDAAWNESLSAIKRETATFAEFAANDPRDLAARIPHGTGQTYLRTILVAVDHTSYHVGQIIAVRRLLGAWNPQ